MFVCFTVFLNFELHSFNLTLIRLGFWHYSSNFFKDYFFQDPSIWVTSVITIFLQRLQMKFTMEWSGGLFFHLALVSWRNRV